MALYELSQDPAYSVERLFTTVNGTYGRVSMHGVRQVLLEQQAAALGIPLQVLSLPEQPGMETYNRLMGTTLAGICAEGFTHAVFGDIFLEDLREYREEQLKTQQIKACFPLWKKDTTWLMHEFIDLGFKTVVVCIKSELLDKSFAGRVIDRDFLKDLPEGVDPCGENGEFHTFVFDGPIFREPVEFKTGKRVYREYKAPGNKDDDCFSGHPPSGQMGFWFCDLLPNT